MSSFLRAYPDLGTAWVRLATYLGKDFDPALTDFERLRKFLDREWSDLHPNFYESSVGYLYDLTHFHFTDAKTVFFRTLAEVVAEHRLTRIADVGCGIALDVQALLQADYDVHGYDLDNPSLRYGRWRLARDLGAAHRLYHIEELEAARHELVYAVDVLGHAISPGELISRLMHAGEYVIVNLQAHTNDPRFGAGDLHPRLDHATVLPYFQELGTLIRLAGDGDSIVTVWRSAQR